MDEIKVTIVTCISNLGKTVTVRTKLTQRTSESKPSDLMTALVMIITPVVIGSLLPPRVVTELELNSINPLPDTVEEEQSRKILKPNKPKKSRLKLKSTQNLSKQG